MIADLLADARDKMQGAVEPVMKINRAGKSRTVVNLSSYNYLGLASNPEDRYRDAKTVARELDSFLESVGIDGENPNH